MVNHTSLGALDEAHQEEAATARRRIDAAEEAVASYRSRMRSMQESIYEVASQKADMSDPVVRAAFQRASDETDENVRAAGQVIARAHEDLDAMTSQHARERERFIAEHSDA